MIDTRTSAKMYLKINLRVHKLRMKYKLANNPNWEMLGNLKSAANTKFEGIKNNEC